MLVRDGKAMPRELTEEEKQAAEEAAKDKKGAKAPAKGGKGQKEEEPSPEELEKLAKEKAEKEERERKFMEEWNALDDETKHIRTNEDIFKQPCIKMVNVAVMEKI